MNLCYKYPYRRGSASGMKEGSCRIIRCYFGAESSLATDNSDNPFERIYYYNAFYTAVVPF